MTTISSYRTAVRHSLRRAALVLACAALVAAVGAAAIAQSRQPAGASALIFANGFEVLPNVPPIANAGANRIATVGTPLALDGSASSDPNGDPLTYLWTLVSRPAASGADLFDATAVGPILIAERAGDYVFQLRVSDGVFTSAPSMVTVSAYGSLPTIALVGITGGAVGTADGASVLIPPNALSSSVTISIANIPPPPAQDLPPTAVVVGPVYDLLPNGTVFDTPVQIVLPYNPAMLPPGYTEGSITIHRRTSTPDFNMVGSENGDEESASHGQDIDVINKRVMARVLSFSAYGALGIRGSAQFTPVTLTEPTASIEIRRPPTLRTNAAVSNRCLTSTAQQALDARPASDIKGIVLHSTNNGNRRRDFEGELGWGADDCNMFFAHYYIDRNGTIFQVVDDLTITFHVAGGGFGIDNDSSIGIELFNSVGEPYDGRQVAAAIRLTDFLMERYSLARPSRSSVTGALVRNLVNVSQGGDRVVGHADLIPAKCDPSGTFRDSGIVKEERYPLNCLVPILVHPLSVGSSLAPSPMDMVVDAIAMLARGTQHTGIINTQGGDAFEMGNAGSGGGITLRENLADVNTAVGTAERINWQQNDPNLTGQPASVMIGPGPLIIAPGASQTLAGSVRDYTDVLIAGTLTVSGPLELRLTGSFYLSPLGKIVVRSGTSGGNLTVYTRGTPIIQGLIDARGEDGVSGSTNGGQGGNVEFVFAAPGLLLAPTFYTRGGDADSANASLAGGGPRGGNGGAVTVSVGATDVFMGGGIGPIIGNVNVPAWRSGNIDPALISPPGRWAGDFLPPPPPFTLSSEGVLTPSVGQRVRKWTLPGQPGFTRGILTSGGMGGWGGNAPANNRHGGPAGNGGAVQITLGTTARLSLRNIDIATGTEIETLRHSFFRALQMSTQTVCDAAGAHGGFSATGGNGGNGGNAGAVTRTGGVLTPAPTQFANIYEIRGFPPGAPMLIEDDSCSRGRFAFGSVIEARDAGNAALYRVRRGSVGATLLGGLGGIPSGTTPGNQGGNVGQLGTSAPLAGLPTQ